LSIEESDRILFIQFDLSMYGFTKLISFLDQINILCWGIGGQVLCFA